MLHNESVTQPIPKWFWPKTKHFSGSLRMRIIDYQMVAPKKTKRNEYLDAESSEMPRHASPYRKVWGRTQHLTR